MHRCSAATLGREPSGASGVRLRDRLHAQYLCPRSLRGVVLPGLGPQESAEGQMVPNKPLPRARCMQ